MSLQAKEIPIKNKTVSLRSYSIVHYLKFIIPSLIGIYLFMVPVKTEDGITIPVAFLAGAINDFLVDYVPVAATWLMMISVLVSIVARISKPNFIMGNSFLRTVFYASNGWLTLRILGSVFAFMSVYKVGPEWIRSENTGGLLAYDLIPILVTTFLLAGFFLPLLLNFGLLELFGALLAKVMRPIFKIPGRSSLDCLASWVGDGTIGVLLTSKQYEGGYYTKREAAVIATTFSVVSITFTIVINSYLDLGEYFLEYYATIVIAGLAAAIIMPRIPPLSRKPDTGYEHTELKVEEGIPANVHPLKHGISEAVLQANRNKNVSSIVKEGFRNVIEMWLAVIPVVMAIGTMGVVIAEYTPVFKYLGMPFIPILSALQIPEAAAASQTMIIGFADMFLPAIIGSGIESEMTRFVIGCVSVTQLVYLSEMGGLLLGSKLPVNLKDLILIFLLRTAITLPIVTLIAHWVF
ncbi:YjiH family protein [Siminovitchia acidinfaciens]|uniref:YjiH family protein n=1 Tax=Siminovitchia acidinfaciens TaxID=2321395 RepID=A0A429XZ78_9BACI|nr:YjiH family protein [Siminovitchia acidinfaciens]RST74111.1 YjiH family protein [Siminovitchia acidinfaciens]